MNACEKRTDQEDKIRYKWDWTLYIKRKKKGSKMLSCVRMYSRQQQPTVDTWHDHTIDTVCVAGWHVLFTPTIYTPTDSQGKGASERLGGGEQNVKKGARQRSHARQPARTHTEGKKKHQMYHMNKLCLLLPPRTGSNERNGVVVMGAAPLVCGLTCFYSH